MSETITDRNRRIVRRIYELGAAGDLAGVAELCTPEYRLTQSPAHPVPGSWTGRAADAAAGRVFQAVGVDGIDVEEIVADGPHRVIALVQSRGVDGRGRPWRMPVAECFWIEEGKVSDIRPFYWDLDLLREVARSRETPTTEQRSELSSERPGTE